MGYILTAIALLLIIAIVVAVLPALSGKGTAAAGRGDDRDEAPVTRSNLGGPQEEKIADQARPSQPENPPG